MHLVTFSYVRHSHRLAPTSPHFKDALAPGHVPPNSGQSMVERRYEVNNAHRPDHPKRTRNENDEPSRGAKCLSKKSPLPRVCNVRCPLSIFLHTDGAHRPRMARRTFSTTQRGGGSVAQRGGGASPDMFSWGQDGTARTERMHKPESRTEKRVRADSTGHAF